MVHARARLLCTVRMIRFFFFYFARSILRENNGLLMGYSRAGDEEGCAYFRTAAR